MARPAASTPTITAAAIAVIAVILAGCASGRHDDPPPAGYAPDPGAMVLAAGRYDGAFDAATGSLRDLGFILDRVDAQEGVITTRPKGTAGLLTPWEPDQSGFRQEVEDMLHRQRRVARIEFSPADGSSAPDLRRFAGPVRMYVWVDVYRWQQSGWRLDTSSIVNSTYSYDPQLGARDMISYGVALSQDPALAERIVQRVIRALPEAGWQRGTPLKQ